MPDILISEFMDEAAIAAHLKGRDVLYDPALVDDPARLLGLAGDARALIVRNRTEVRGPLLEAARRLVIVGRLGVGLDNIDVAACQARGVAVRPASGANDLAVAEYVIAAALMLVRGAYLSTAAVAAGAWPRNALIGGEVSGRTLGLVGYGAIARETATRAAALGMRIAAFDPHLPAGDPRWAGAERLDFNALLARADVLSMHVPLTDETRNLVDTAAIARMKPTAVLVNAARGGVLDEAALAAALREKRIAGAALDVFAEEPLGPARGALFAGLPNVVLTPHIAGVTHESNTRVSDVIARAVAEALG